MVVFSGKNHISFYIFATILLFIKDYNNFNEQDLIFCFAAFVGCLLPDVDHPQAIAGHIIPLHKICKHGRATHTLLVNSLFLVAPYLITGYIHSAFQGLAFGYFTHLFGDNIDGNNLKYLYFPFKRKKSKRN